ncbi:TonB-dependent siderophore receptor [Mucilaginibacter ginkgonis]|uniref:TonB-dependent receptor n=1 Tax=Mucilaginibacter ginkgonis TaxID=2682091 RepID=A0A6I4HYR2_9SPHI|nr:TonB-dependent receptor [Mucilaginibacter ginkgonis]QQL49600.1 TonB-dependent receptor [Mucilaginibacter ginkgonis]
MYKYLSTIPLVFFFNILLAQSTKRDTTKKDSTNHNLKEVTVTTRYYKTYKIDRSSNTLKLTTPLLKLPQNIQEVDKDVLTDQQAINISESITRNVSGAMRNNTADFYNPFIFMRGAAVNTLRNGMDVSMIYYGPTPEDASIIDRMEFIKGPAGYVNAIGDPAGSFNLVTKQPTGTNNNHINFTAGSFNLYRLSVDLDDNLNDDKKWQYRLNVTGQKAKSFQKFAFNDKLVIDPVLKYNIDEHSYISAEYIYTQQQFKQYLLTVFTPYGFGSLPTDFSITDPNNTPTKAFENNAFLTYHNSFNSKWQLTAKATYVADNLTGSYFFVSKYTPATPNLLQRRVTYEKFNTSVFAAQAFLNGEFATGAITHKILAGLDYNNKNLLAYSGYNDPTANQALYPLDVNNPVYGIPFDANVKQGKLADIATNKSAVRYGAAYAQDELNMLDDRLRVTIAARLTTSTSSIAIPTVTGVSNTVVTPRLGLDYSLTNNFSAYALFDKTFTPQSGISATGGLFAPLRGQDLEAGLKKDWANGKWNTTLSVYRITRNNIIVTDPATNLQSQIGQTISKGIEFDLKGEIVKGLDCVINYAYTDAYISKDANATLIGLPAPYRVKHIQNTWLNYKLPLKSISGFALSGGYQLQTGRAGRYSQENGLNIAPIFRLDGGIGWSNSRFSVNGIVNNILNRLNYGSAWITPVAINPTGLYAYVPYPPREYRVSIGYSF